MCSVRHTGRHGRKKQNDLVSTVSRRNAFVFSSDVVSVKYRPQIRMQCDRSLTRGFSTSANFESKLAVRALMWPANSGTPRSSLVYLPVTYVPGDTSSKAKTLGLQHL
jgi:hypothetical protein